MYHTTFTRKSLLLSVRNFFFFLSRAVFVPLRRGVSFTGFSPPLLAISCVVFRYAARLHVLLDNIHPSSSWSPSWPLTIDFHLLYNLPDIVIRPSFDVAVPAEAVFLCFLDDWRHIESSSGLSDGDLVKPRHPACPAEHPHLSCVHCLLMLPGGCPAFTSIHECWSDHCPVDLAFQS